MGTQTFVKYVVLSLAALPLQGANALGLGDAELRSSLGAPLELHIPVRHLGNLTEDDLKLVLSTTEDGISGLPLESKVRSKYTLTYDAKAQAAILRSDTAVVEPYIAFTLNVLWPTGYLKREYTVLMDLPDIALDQRVAKSSSSVVEDKRATEARSPATRSKPPARVTRRQAISQSDREYRVARGDSLWTLAGSLSRQRGGSREQWMASLFQENPRAFVRGEPERLKEAWMLSIPESAGDSRLVFTRGGKGYELIDPSFKVAETTSRVADRVVEITPEESFTREEPTSTYTAPVSDEKLRDELLAIAEIERQAFYSAESMPQPAEEATEQPTASENPSRAEMLERVAALEARLAQVRAQMDKPAQPSVPDVETTSALAVGLPLIARFHKPLLRSLGWTALGMVLGLGCLFAREWRLHRRLSALQRRLSDDQGWSS